jgi:hypothetical protein
MLNGMNELARRRMRAVLSALCSALILVILTIQIGGYEGNQKTSLNQNIGPINQEFIDELEKGFAPHDDTRPSRASKFHSYLNVRYRCKMRENQSVLRSDSPL